MTDTRGDPVREARRDRTVELRLAAVVGNLAVVRTLVGVVGALEDFDLDNVADLQLAVDEACTRLVRASSVGATLDVVVGPASDAVRVEACVATRADHDVIAPGSFSWHVLTALVDEVRTFRDGEQPGVGGQVFGVVLTKCRTAAG